MEDKFNLKNDFLFEKDENNDCNFKILMKHSSNGFLRILILWIINKETIHGYGIMKYLDEFFKIHIDKDVISKFNSSKVYPILYEMEKDNLISGTDGINNGKKVKFYNITPKGEKLLMHINFKNQELLSQDIWADFLEDIGIKIITD